jgi:peptide/nickel transport system permease protein
MIARLPIALLALWALLALVGPFLPLAPDEIHLPLILRPPGLGLVWDQGLGGVFGYDDLGRSVAARLLTGAHLSFLIALTVVLISAAVGTTLGLVAGWLGGGFDFLLMRIVDVFLAFPGILLAIALAGLLGPGEGNVVIALSVTGWVGYARLTRAQALSLKHRDHVAAAVALGTTTPHILWRHLLPLLLAPLLVEATFSIAAVVLAEAGLSFLGIGVQPPTATWGNMIRDGVRYMLMAPHLVLFPGAALALVVLAVNLTGDHLRDRLDVRERTRP